jgi:hypothetical protein
LKPTIKKTIAVSNKLIIEFLMDSDGRLLRHRQWKPAVYGVNGQFEYIENGFLQLIMKGKI